MLGALLPAAKGVALLLVLRIYGALLAVLDSIPLLPGLLELAGLIAVVIVTSVTAVGTKLDSIFNTVATKI